MPKMAIILGLSALLPAALLPVVCYYIWKKRKNASAEGQLKKSLAFVCTSALHSTPLT